jgi:hypothetical protein
MAPGGAPEALAVKRAALKSLLAATYRPHPLHREERAFGESNCYVDLWIEFLHAWGLEPMALLAFTASVDFEGDQWTFFKPPLGELELLYGVSVQELNVWHSLGEHVLEQLHLGRLVVAEADAFYLPDTSGTDYKTRHSKTTVGIQAIDLDSGVMGYFHNGGYYEVGGEDCRRALTPTDGGLPLYVEFVKLDHVKARPPADLLAQSVSLLRHHLSLRPARNPFARFKPRFVSDVRWLQTEAQDLFHVYAFSTVRQCGASYGLLADFLRWLKGQGEGGLEPGIEHFSAIAEDSKALILKAARAVAVKRPTDFEPMLDGLAGHWDSGMANLAARYG